jgi:ribosomal protein S12
MLYDARLNSRRNQPRVITVGARNPQAALRKAVRKAGEEEVVLVLVERAFNGKVVYDCTAIRVGF